MTKAKASATSPPENEPLSEAMRDKVENLILKGYSVSQIVKITKLTREVIAKVASNFLLEVSQKYNLTFSNAKGLKLEELAGVKSRYWQQYEIFEQDKDLINSKKLLDSITRLIVEEAKIFGLYSDKEQEKGLEGAIEVEMFMEYLEYRNQKERTKNTH
jgi:hypothetical protein